MATSVQARRLAAADREQLEDENQIMGTSRNRPATLYAGRILHATNQHANVLPAAHKLVRPGMGRQMSSVVRSSPMH